MLAKPSGVGCRFVNRLTRMTNVQHVSLLDPETPAVVSREKARQTHAVSRRSRSKSKDRLSATRSKSPASSLGGSTPRSISPGRAIGDMWKRVAGLALRWSRGHYRDNMRITGREHMSDVDCFDGDRMRKGRFERDQQKAAKTLDGESGKGGENVELTGSEEDLASIHPIVDGRLKDEGRK